MKSLLERISANADELRKERAKLVASSAVAASTSRLLSVKQDLLEKLSNIEYLLDLGATSTTDIGTHLRSFNAVDWAENLYGDNGLNGLIATIINLNARIRVHNALFPTDTIEELDETSSEILKTMLKSMNRKNDTTRSNKSRKRKSK